MRLVTYLIFNAKSDSKVIVQVNSLQSNDLLGRRGDTKDDPAEILTQSFSAAGRCEQFRHGHGCPLFDVVHPEFPLPTTASLTLLDALKDGFGEAVVAHDMPAPCKFPSVLEDPQGS